MTRSLVLLIVLLVAASAACSGGGGDDEAELAEAIKAEILADGSSANLLGEEEAECASIRIVDEFGADGLADLGVTVGNAAPDDLFTLMSDAQLDAVIDITTECVDFAELFVAQFSAGEAPGISRDSADCLATGLSESDVFRPLIRAGLSGGDADFDTLLTRDPATAQQVLELVIGCLSAEEIAEFGS